MKKAEKDLRAPCPKCGAQPEVKKGKTYWTASCPTPHVLARVAGNPMKTKKDALDAWDYVVKHEYFGVAPSRSATSGEGGHAPEK